MKRNVLVKVLIAWTKWTEALTNEKRSPETGISVGRKWLRKHCRCEHRLLLLLFFRQGGHLRGWSPRTQENSGLGSPSQGAGPGMFKDHSLPQRSGPWAPVWAALQDFHRLTTALGRFPPHFDWECLLEFPSPRLPLVHVWRADDTSFRFTVSGSLWDISKELPWGASHTCEPEAGWRSPP